MIFTTHWFVLFAVSYFLVFWAVQLPWIRLGLLLLGCFIFYAHFAGAAGMLPIVVLAATTYVAGLWRRRVALVNPAWGQQTNHLASVVLPMGAPLAVSFFVFEFVHYLYDISKGSPSIRNPAHFCAFAFFFPSLVAGPIKRYEPFLPSLRSGLRSVSSDDVKLGLMRVALGFFKKLVIADNVAAGLQYWQPRYASLTLHSRWEFLAATGIRILCDFSGYSDIAIGLSRMMGVTLPENFRWPYLATSVTEFWHRWHISLSTWIRDYVYIPLGGNRSGRVRTIANGFIAFALCGLWHGPSWNFVFWGVYHGSGLVISSNYESSLGPFGAVLARFFARLPIAGWGITLGFVLIGWLYFFYPFAEASQMLRMLFVRKP